MSDDELRDEVLDLAQRLIRIDTSNPPGGETPAAELLAAYLGEAGAECELVGPDPARLNLIARVRGNGGPSLMLMAHTDVVPAPADGWTVPPFDAVVRDGMLVGRGACDMKGELAARAVALAALARSGEALAGDVVLVAEADEERNVSDVGMSWLVREHPEVRCDYALNEGGGVLLELADGRRAVTIAVGEKRTASARIRVKGRGGHASVPAAADNPVGHAARAVELLLDHGAEPRIPDEIASALVELGAPADDPEAAVEHVGRLHPYLALTLPPITRLMVTPTGLQTHEPANVIPPFADVICDCRGLPGQGEEDFRAHVEAAIGGHVSYEFEFLEPLEGGTSSAIDNELFRACRDYVKERLGAVLLPLISTGFTDSHYVREAHGTVAYGFAPVFATPLDDYEEGVHAADERIAVEDLLEMTKLNLHAARALV